MRWVLGTILPVVMSFFSVFIMTTPVLFAGTNSTHQIQMYLQMHPVNVDQLQEMTQRQLKVIESIPSSMIRRMAIWPAKVRITLFPVVSAALTPGIVNSRKVNLPLERPIFFIGDDQQSMRWLTRYATRLISLKAKGFVVNVKLKSKLQALRQIVPAVPLYSMPGDAVASWLHIKHYPVLISAHLIEQ